MTNEKRPMTNGKQWKMPPHLTKALQHRILNKIEKNIMFGASIKKCITMIQLTISPGS